MSDDLFLITGGGTGAKVAESLVHLCAAGLGPDRLHLLLIDSDTANGNLGRTQSTVRSYQKMAKWPWNVKTRSDGDPFGLFQTEIRVHEITEPIETVNKGGLETAVESSDMQDVLDLLFDEEEQQARCEDGFRARPNLGCLLMAEHLEKRLPKDAGSFLNDLETAAGRHQRVPVVVAASVFGGTGASLFPVIQETIEGNFGNDELTGSLEWSAIQLLPHYQPQEKKESVDPDRFVLDTSSALQYYSLTHGDAGNGQENSALFDAMYTIGSDDPARNKVKTILGSGEQSNPPYFEEALAALSALDATARQPAPDQPVRVYMPDQLSWTSLPYSNPVALKERMAVLLHLAAFYMHPAGQGENSQLDHGLGTMVRDVAGEDLQMYSWYDTLLDDWATQALGSRYTSANGEGKVRALRETILGTMDKDIAEFMGRHLLWAETALKGQTFSFVEYENESYARIYDAMGEVEAGEINTTSREGSVEEDEDGALIRLLRGAVAAFLFDDQGKTDEGLLNRISLFDVDGQHVPIRITKQQVRRALRTFDRERVVDEYTKTRPS